MNFTHHNFDFLPWSLKIPSLFTEPWILTLEPYRKLSITNLISSLSPSLLNKMTTLCSLNSKTVPSTLTKFEEKNNFLHTQVLHSSLTWNLGKIPNYFNPKFSISHFTQLLTTKVTEHLQSNRSANRARKEPTHSAQTIQTRDNSNPKKKRTTNTRKLAPPVWLIRKNPVTFPAFSRQPNRDSNTEWEMRRRTWRTDAVEYLSELSIFEKIWTENVGVAMFERFEFDEKKKVVKREKWIGEGEK